MAVAISPITQVLRLGRDTRPPTRRAIFGRTSPAPGHRRAGKTSSACRPAHPVQFCHGDAEGLGFGRIPEPRFAVGHQAGGWLAVGHHEQDRLQGGVLAEKPPGQQQPVVQVGALLSQRGERREFVDLHRLGVSAELDQLQPVPRNRVETRWCRARAVRFIGTQRPSAAIEKEIRRAGRRLPGCGPPSPGPRRPVGQAQPGPGSPPSATVRRIALVTVRVTSHGSASPNSHGRLDPVCSPAAPASRVSRWPCRPESCPAASFSSDCRAGASLAGRAEGRRRYRAGAFRSPQGLLDCRKCAGGDCGVLSELAVEVVKVEVGEARAA